MKVKVSRTIVWIVDSTVTAKELNRQEAEEDGFMYDLTGLDSAQHVSTIDKATELKGVK